MGFDLQSPENIVRNKTGFTIVSYQVHRISRSMSVCGHWDYDDGTTRKFSQIVISDEDEDGEVTTEFTDFYETYLNDSDLYKKVAGKLAATGTVDLQGEIE